MHFKICPKPWPWNFDNNENHSKINSIVTLQSWEVNLNLQFSWYIKHRYFYSSLHFDTWSRVKCVDVIVFILMWLITSIKYSNHFVHSIQLTRLISEAPWPSSIVFSYFCIWGLLETWNMIVKNWKLLICYCVDNTATSFTSSSSTNYLRMDLSVRDYPYFSLPNIKDKEEMNEKILQILVFLIVILLFIMLFVSLKFIDALSIV